MSFLAAMATQGCRLCCYLSMDGSGIISPIVQRRSMHPSPLQLLQQREETNQGVQLQCEHTGSDSTAKRPSIRKRRWRASHASHPARGCNRHGARPALHCGQRSYRASQRHGWCRFRTSHMHRLCGSFSCASQRCTSGECECYTLKCENRTYQSSASTKY